MIRPNDADEIESIAVVGAGLMGHGIALTYALAGRAVALYDVDEAVLEASRDRITAAAEALVENGIVAESAAAAAGERITHTGEFEAAVAGADLVTEAVTEDLEIKRAVFERLDDAAPEAILATNTSSFSIDDVTEPVADGTRVLGTHWFNPPYVVPLVEVVKGSATDDGLAEIVSDLLESAGKAPVTVEKDVPGFIGNRIQAAMAYEAFSLLERGVASAADIDRAVKAGFGFRLPIMGIFEKVDQSGLAVHHEMERQLMGDLDRGTEPNPVVEELLAAGHDGVASGKGVYDWSAADEATVYRNRDDALLELLELYRSQKPQSIDPNYDRTGE